MSGRSSEDDAVAPTVAATKLTAPTRSSRPAIDDLLPGAQLGRYRLKARLGAGAMGVVWSAHDPKLDRDVAIKLVHAELANEEASGRLMREAKAMAKLSHRSVITVYDADDVDGKLFLAMELVRGTTLGQLLRARDDTASADWRKWLAMMMDAGRGLAEAHDNGVLHRDFKPDNVLVDGSGRVCVGDFGLAMLGESLAAQSRQWNAAHASDSGLELTTTGALLGTPVYMSPQQLGGEPIDARADQFAFCVATWEALYGERPFAVAPRGFEAIAMLVAAIAKGPNEPPPGTAVPAAVRDVIRRGLAFDPADRWPDMAALLAALEVAAKQPVTPPAERSRRRWFALGGLVALAAIAIVVIAILRPGATERVARPELVKVFSTPLNTRTAISPSGKTIALGGDVLEVRSPDGKVNKTTTLPQASVIFHLEVDDREVRFSMDSGPMRWRWRFLDEPSPVIEVEDVGGRWRGTTTRGDLVRPLTDRGLAFVRPDRTIETWAPVIDIVAISTDRRRVAYVEGGRFMGEIVVRDVETGRVVRSGPVEEPTAIVWTSPTTLVFATGALDRPRIERVEIGERFGTPELAYETRTGWFSDLAFGGGQLYVVTMPPTPRGRVIPRGSSAGRSELDSVSLGLAWGAKDTLVTWNASNLQVRPATGTPATLATEPMNATIAGDILIATLRERGGRRAVAVSLADGSTVWASPDKRTIGVRCAGDRAPPCFAIRNVREDLDQVMAIDPRTGVTDPRVLFEAARIDDFAVRADGQRIVVAGFGLARGVALRELSLAGDVVQDYSLKDPSGRTRLSVIRSVAYDPMGGFILGGTSGRNAYQVGRLHDGHYEPLDEARDKILSLVRPSSDGTRIVFIARGFAPELQQLRDP